jgi:hypothetical protein
MAVRMRELLLCPPDHYGIEYEINPWMSRQKQPDHEQAVAQWNALRNLLEAAGGRTLLLEPVPGLPDLVFTANAALVYRRRAVAAGWRVAGTYQTRKLDGAIHWIKLDVSDDELVVNTEHVRLIERWPDISEVQVLAYTRVEVTAEKLRCLIQRFQCRDLLDLDLLLEDGVDLVDAAALFARKAAHKGIDPSSFEAAFEGKLDRYRKAWSTELLQYLPDIPHFDQVERRVRRALRRARLIT